MSNACGWPSGMSVTTVAKFGPWARRTTSGLRGISIPLSDECTICQYLSAMRSGSNGVPGALWPAIMTLAPRLASRQPRGRRRRRGEGRARRRGGSMLRLRQVDLGRISSAALMLSGVAGALMPKRVAAALDLPATSARGVAETRAALGGTYAALGGWALVSRAPAARVAVG